MKNSFYVQTKIKRVKPRDGHSWKFNISFTGAPERESKSRKMIKHITKAKSLCQRMQVFSIKLSS